MSGSRRYMTANDAAAAANGGGKHWTKSERALRLASEVKPPTDKRVLAPKWLKDETLRKEFYSLRDQLVAMDTGFSKSDADFLAWYLTARQEYNAASNHVRKAINEGDPQAAAAWTRTRNKFFTEARACANELGLTINSRCKLIAPPAEPEANPLEDLRKRFAVMEA